MNKNKKGAAVDCLDDRVCENDVPEIDALVGVLP